MGSLLSLFVVLRVIPQDNILTTTQKFYCNSSFLKKLEFKYGLIPISEDIQVLCRLQSIHKIHDSFCRVDTSVVNISGMKRNSDGLPCSKLKLKLPLTIDGSKIKVLEKPILNIKSAKVSVVFETVEKAGLWNQKKSNLLELVLSILELGLYIIVEHSVIYLKNLKANENAGIFCVVIHCNKMSGACGKITSRTKLELTSIVSKLEYEQFQELSDLPPSAGLERPFDELQEIINHRLQYVESGYTNGISPSQKVLLAGPPGCGKTSLVQRVCAECRAPLITVTGGMCADSLPGEAETKLREAFSRAASISRGVLLLDQLDSICPKRTDSTPSHIARLTSQLLTLLEDPNGPAFIIATTSRPHVIEPSARRPGRLDREIFIGPPTQLDRKNILKALLKPQQAAGLEELCCEGARLTPGYVAADLALLARETALRVWRKGGSKTTWGAELKGAVALMRPASLRGGLGVVTSEHMSLDQLGGLDDIKLRLQATIEWPLKHPQAFARLGLSRPKGVLLYGPPGCAKTSLVRAMASASGTTFLAISAAELYSPLVGDTERSLVSLFQRARAASPAILFIDEIDALVGGRGEGSECTNGVQERVLSALLVELDGTTVPSSGGGVMVVAATNRPDLLDAALMRPGRLDKLVLVPAPDLTTRLAILTTVTASMPLAPDVDLQLLASSSELYSGADLQNLCREAALCALTQGGMTVQIIEAEHFLLALEQTRPSLSPSQLTWYNKYQPGR